MSYTEDPWLAALMGGWCLQITEIGVVNWWWQPYKTHSLHSPGFNKTNHCATSKSERFTALSFQFPVGKNQFFIWGAILSSIVELLLLLCQWILNNQPHYRDILYEVLFYCLGFVFLKTWVFNIWPLKASANDNPNLISVS